MAYSDRAVQKDNRTVTMAQYDFYRKLIALSFVQKIFLFGSRARKDNQERSDIDLAVFCPSATDREWLKLLDILDDADTLLKIDCVRWDQLSVKSPLRKNIETEGVALYVKNNP